MADLDTPDPTTGLTGRQKSAIRESWQVVSSDLKGNGVNLLIQFFTDFPKDQAYFKKFAGKNPGDLRDDSLMKLHATQVMSALSSVVDSLDEPDVLIGLLKKNANDHMPRGVRIQQYSDLFATFVKYIEAAAKGKFNEATKTAWEKALDTVGKILDAEQKQLSQ